MIIRFPGIAFIKEYFSKNESAYRPFGRKLIRKTFYRTDSWPYVAREDCNQCGQMAGFFV